MATAFFSSKLCEKELTRFPPPSQLYPFSPSHSDKIHALVCVLKKYISIFILRIAQIIYLKKMLLFIFYCVESFQSWPILASQYTQLLFISLPFHVYMKKILFALLSFIRLNSAYFMTNFILSLLFLTFKTYLSLPIRFFFHFYVWFFSGHNLIKEAGPAWLLAGSTQHFTISYPAVE